MARDDKRKEVRERDTSTPTPVDPAFTEWVIELFREDEKAHHISITQLWGKYGKTIGEQVKKHDFKVGVTPSREELVGVSNALIEVMQHEADTFKAPMFFAVTAHNPKRGVPHFDRRVMEFLPKRVLRLGEKQSESGEIDWDEEHPMFASGGDMLRARTGDVLKDAQYYHGQMVSMFGGFMNFSMDIINEMRTDAKEARAAWLDATKARNEAENNALDREVVREREKFRIKAMERGVNLLAGLLPGAAAKLLGDGGANGANGANGNGKQLAAPARTAESLAIESVMDALSAEEKARIFGKWTDAGVRVQEGILGENQVRILMAVLKQEAPPDALDVMVPGQGADSLTDEQGAAIVAAIGGEIDKFTGILKTLNDRRAAVAARAAAARTAPPPPPAPK